MESACAQRRGQGLQQWRDLVVEEDFELLLGFHDGDRRGRVLRLVDNLLSRVGGVNARCDAPGHDPRELALQASSRDQTGGGADELAGGWEKRTMSHSGLLNP